MLRMFSLVVLAVFFSSVAVPEGIAQPDDRRLDRVPFNDRPLFLSGANVAWVNFARDIGPGTTNLSVFSSMFSDLSDEGGNAMRLWLHTTGANTPEWNEFDVVGPGNSAIGDLEAILDRAQEHNVGLILCLWSFDMLRISNGPGITDRSMALLTDSARTQTYIDNALVPMVEALAGHPAIIAWEIFNEAEGMSNEFGWNITRHVPMADIQRFVNMTAGAIHRVAPDERVTNGVWSFRALSDGVAAKTASEIPAPLTGQQLDALQTSLSQKYRHPFTVEETRQYYQKGQSANGYNYYRDDRLIEAGGDSLGTLDFYSVHYYEWAGTAESPFHNDFEVWGLDKPLVVAEFFMGGGQDSDPDAAFGVHYRDMYPTLLERGYAGALAWQWYNYPNSAEGVVNWPRILESTDEMRLLHPDAVLVDPGFSIAFFRASSNGIEMGGESELTWFVFNAEEVYLNDAPVDSTGSLVVSPGETTTYTLTAIDALGDTLVAQQEVRVLAPNEVNRALQGIASSSSIERCCAIDRQPESAFDGDQTTRWSSTWNQDEADEDPDDEWIYVDLGAAYDVERVILRWEVAYGKAYSIDVSLDEQVWTTVFEERNSDGGADEIQFEQPVLARYVRMQGIERATTFGYSLWEFEVYGIISALQPPEISFVTPIDGLLLPVGADTVLVVDAIDRDSESLEVSFTLNDSLLATVTEPPYAMPWSNALPGVYRIAATAVDSDALRATTRVQTMYVIEDTAFDQFEAEGAELTGNATQEINANASGLFYASLESGGQLTFADLPAGDRGERLMTIRYLLDETDRAELDVILNGEKMESLSLSRGETLWNERGYIVDLKNGSNTLALRNITSLVGIDFVKLGRVVRNVAQEEAETVSYTFELNANFPNPFRETTTIEYSLAQAEHVVLELFDGTGKRVKTVIDAVQPPGRYRVPVSAKSLASGMYFYRMRAGAFTETKQMTLIR